MQETNYKYNTYIATNINGVIKNKQQIIVFTTFVKRINISFIGEILKNINR